MESARFSFFPWELCSCWNIYMIGGGGWCPLWKSIF